MIFLESEQRAGEPIAFPKASEYRMDPITIAGRYFALQIVTELDSLLYSTEAPTQHRRLIAALRIGEAREGLDACGIAPDEYRQMDAAELSNPFGAVRLVGSLLLEAAERPVPNMPILERDIRRNEKIAIATRDRSLMASERQRALRNAEYLNTLFGFSYEVFGERDPRLGRPGKHIQIMPR